MKTIRNTRFLQISGLLLSALVWLAQISNPSNGNTGAPFDENCSSCHTGNNENGFNGTVAVTGMPGVVQPNTVYPLLLTITPTAGSSVRAGFQLVAVDGGELNAGDLAAANAQTGTEFSGGREYLDHRGTKNFGGNPVSWNFNWTSPAVATGAEIKFYFIGVFGNNDGTAGGDHSIPAVATYTFNGPSEPVGASISGSTNVTCNGGNNGSATVTAVGGTSPYSYAWSHGPTTPTISNLSAGSYTVTVTGSSGSGTASATVQITQPAAMTVMVNVNGVITCAQPTANISATVQGGASPYTFLWSNQATTQQTTFSQPGSYTVTVTDNNGCTKTAPGNVTSNTTLPLATIALPSVITCNNPSITLDGGGSSSGGNFTYLWTASNGGHIVTGQNTLTPEVNTCGTYTLMVTNTTNGCTATASRDVICNTSQPQVTAIGGVLTCNNTSITLSASSTTPGVSFSYVWSGPCINAGTQNQPQPVVCQPGAYTVTVTNLSTGCTNTATALVEQNTVLPIAAIAPPGTLNCNNTSIQLNASATTSQGSEFTYSWTTQNGNISAGAQTLTPIVDQPGTYRLIVTNITNACTAEVSATVIQRTPVAAVASATPVSCFGAANGSASVQASGGSGPYTYLWNSGHTTNVANNLTAGTYTPSITDSEGCTATATAVVAQPAVLQLSATATAETALNLEDGTATASATGGTPAYSYAWSNGANTAFISGLSPGSYTVTATDANGCTAIQIVNVNSFNCNVQTEMIVSPVKCFGTSSGGATVSVTGATGELTYQWSNGAATETVDDLPGGIIYVTATDGLGCSVVDSAEIASPAGPLLASVTNIIPVYCPLDQNGSATPVTSGGWGFPYSFQFSWGLGGFNNLPVGNYSYTVTDMEGCSVVADFEIVSIDSIAPTLVCPENYVLCGADLLDYSVSVVSDDCAGGDAEATLVSGQPSGSAFLDGVTTQLFSATDASGNTATCSFTVTVFPLSDVIINSTTNDMNSAGTGSIDIEPVGDSGPYTFEWKKDGVFFADTEDLSGLSMGTYTLIMTDVNGCTVQLSPIDIDNLTGTDDPSMVRPNIKLWPNPARNTFRLEMTNIVPVAVEILHAQGPSLRVLESSEWNSEISVSGLPAGFYLLKIVDRNGNCQVVKWVKGE